jgi:hypothetical protein
MRVIHHRFHVVEKSEPGLDTSVRICTLPRPDSKNATEVCKTGLPVSVCAHTIYHNHMEYCHRQVNTVQSIVQRPNRLILFL